VQVLDEGSMLTCAVTAHSEAGGSAAASSRGARVQSPQVPGCPQASGRLSGATLGLVKLGMTRAAARRAFSHSSDRGKRYEEFFCLTPIGVRVGYASARLRSTLPAAARNRVSGRVVWASTSNPYYALSGIRPGARVAAARARLHLAAPYQFGLNTWYFARRATFTVVLKVRHGVVEEVGIANKALTSGRAGERAFLSAFS
jgi:hypothetical protein